MKKIALSIVSSLILMSYAKADIRHLQNEPEKLIRHYYSEFKKDRDTWADYNPIDESVFRGGYLRTLELDRSLFEEEGVYCIDYDMVIAAQDWDPVEIRNTIRYQTNYVTDISATVTVQLYGEEFSHIVVWHLQKEDNLWYIVDLYDVSDDFFFSQFCDAILSQKNEIE